MVNLYSFIKDNRDSLSKFEKVILEDNKEFFKVRKDFYEKSKTVYLNAIKIFEEKCTSKYNNLCLFGKDAFIKK